LSIAKKVSFLQSSDHRGGSTWFRYFPA